jgi:hypothetical protein
MEAIDNEGKGRFVLQHVCHWCPTSAENTDIEVECILIDEVSPSSANLHEVEPPTFILPLPPLECVEVGKIAFD